MPELPMFPLGTVLYPHMVLPLHVFEPRYRALVEEILAGERRFGVTLIERGHEVGGGDVRTDLGTVAHVVKAERLDEERWFVIAVGVERFRVEQWLPDDPFPRAEVSFLPEQHADADAEVVKEQLFPRLRRVLALRAELGEDEVPATFEPAEDAEVACWQAAVLSPLTAFDAQQVLAAADCRDRAALLDELLNGLEDDLRFHLTEGG